MKRFKKTAAVFVAALSLASVFTGCTTAKGETADKAKEEKNQKTVSIDAEKREIERPEKMDKIAITCYGGTTHEISILGAGDRITAQPDMKRFKQLMKMYPRFEKVVDPGSFDNVNIEEILKAEPDMAFVGITSKKGNKQIEDAGIKTYTMLIGTAAVDSLKEEFINVGKILSKEEEADRLLKYWDEKLEMVKNLVKDIPEEKRKSVYYCGEKITSANKGIWGGSFIEICGGKNVLKDITGGAKGAEISVEQIASFNPDIVITQKRPSGIKPIISDKRVQDLDFIKNKQVYQCPTGAFWWDRPSPESPLGFMWLAKTLYPEETKSIDLKKETKEFYKEFYGYELSDQEYDSFF